MSNEIDLYKDLEVAERKYQNSVDADDKKSKKYWKKAIKTITNEIKEKYPDLSLEKSRFSFGKDKFVSVSCVPGWNGGHSTIISLYIRNNEKDTTGTEYRMDLTDLKPILYSLEYEVEEPKGSQKYPYLVPIFKEE
jgi:hypothetical protein